MSSVSDLEQLSLQRLQAVRPLLLRLHKDLMEATKLAYETRHGRITSTGDYFRLVLDDDFFSWLRPISQFIVRIDERIAAKKLSEAEDAEKLVLEARQLLEAIAHSTGLEHPYHQALQHNSGITKLYAEVIQRLNA